MNSILTNAAASAFALSLGMIGIAGSVADAAVITVTQSARGSVTPPQAPGNQSVQNGDFFIQANPAAPITGDMVDETTFWWFSFSNDRNFTAFRNSTLPVRAATLRLTLTQPYASGPLTDLVRPVALFPIIPMPHFLGQNETGSIDFNLLDYYTPAQIKTLLTDQSGRVQFVYADDAVVSFARLTVSLACPSDFNADNQTDFFDYLDFVSAFAGENPAADMNGDSTVDFFDYLDFVAAFDAGC